MSRSMPSNSAAERMLLGGVLKEPEWLAELQDTVRADDFYMAQHARLWSWLVEQSKAGHAIDPVTIFDRMPQALWTQVGSIEYVCELPDHVPSTVNLGHYAEVICELASRRALIASAAGWIDQAHEPDPDGSLIDTILSDVQKIRQPGAVRGEWIGSGADDYLDQKEHERLHGKSPHMRLGWNSVDRILKISPGDLIVVGARPGMGKTAWVLNALLWRAGHLKEPGGMFSLEMSRRQLMDRLVCTRSGINLKKVASPRSLTPDQWQRVCDVTAEIEELPVLVDYRSNLSLEEIRAEARRWVHLHGVKLIVIDYLQLMGADERLPREQQVARISKGLKQLAKDLQIGVVALAQLNRGVDARSDKRPMVSDLRESGALEQDADAIGFLYRDHYYTENPTTVRDAELLIRKQRNGPTGTVNLRFFGEVQLFKDMPPPPSPSASSPDPPPSGPSEREDDQLKLHKAGDGKEST